MDTALLEPRSMGRPKKIVGTTSMRLNDDAHQLARQACGFTGESLVEYVSRVVLEQAERDVRAGAEKFLMENNRKTKKGDRGGAK
jgi:hypothetical protein